MDCRQTGPSATPIDLAGPLEDCPSPSGRLRALHCLLVRSPASYLAIALLAFLFALSCYRAAVQSITVDEAFTYNRSVSAPLSRTFKVYDANNHPLHTMLVKASVALFGVSEFSVRLPSLLAAAIYFVVILRLCRVIFKEGWLLLLAVACLSMNPTVLDFLSISRGYGMAMALLMAALDLLLTYLDRPDRRLVHLAAMALALAVTANLTAVFPGVALSLVFTAVYITGGDSPGLGRRFWHITKHLLVPGLVMASALLAVPLAPVRKSSFYFGASSLEDSSLSLVRASLYRYRNFWWQSRAEEWVLPPLPLIARYAVPAVLASVLVVLVVLAVRGLRKRSWNALGPADRLFLLNGGTLLAGIGLAIVAWRAFGAPLPIRRTALWVVPLFSLACLGLLARAGRWKAPLIAAALLCLIQFALEFDVTCYDEWYFDASTRDIVEFLRGRVPARAPIRIGANWVLEHSLEFYKTKYKLGWAIGRGGPDGNFDYYIVFREDEPVVKKRNLRVIREYPFSGASLAVPAGSAVP